MLTGISQEGREKATTRNKKNYNNRKKSNVMNSLINGTEIPEERKGQNKYLKKYYK